MTTDARQSLTDYFRALLLTVVGQAFAAAGYHLEERPAQWAGGLFRFTADLGSGVRGGIAFQLLAYTDTEWSSASPSRFTVTLSRRAPPGAALPSAERALSRLVVDDFGVAILPSADHWWLFSGTEELGRALAEAGYLTVGYGLPWLSGDLLPPSG
ncbi:MAG: hypothetical protein ACUVSX_11835 [Aggregatilineales bacterium]